MGPTNMPLWARSTANDVRSVQSTFTNWNTCMSKAYCKWPVIVGIIIGGVIVVCVLGCIINCLCCGYQCCAACCGCCSCCCPSGRRRNKAPKYYDEAPPPHAANPTYQPPPAPPAYRGAVQTATFDNSKSPAAKADEDALPAMPTWAGAMDKRVEDPSHRPEDVEMEPLNPHGQTPDRNQGAGTPMHSGAAYADYPPDRGTPIAGYRGFNPTDPYARRSPGPAGALAAAQDPYGRRSPGMNTSPVDPYSRRSPGPGAGYAAAHDPYTRRSPGPAAAYAGAQDHQPYHGPYDDYNNINNMNMDNPPYQGVTSPSPVAAYKPPTTYSPVPMSFTPSTDRTQTPGFARQPSFGSSQYPPTYTSQPPPLQTQGYSQGQYTAYGSNEYGGGAIGMAVSEPEKDYRTPSLLQSGRPPAPGSYRDV